MWWPVCVVLLSACCLCGGEGRKPPTCESGVYCYGALLHTVQMASIFPDSKTFVDMKLKQDPNDTLVMFDRMMRQSDHKPSRKRIEEFVEEAFEPAGSEFEAWEPSDWVPSPEFLKRVADPSLRGWASQLNSMWKMLGRKMKEDVRLNPSRYSIIHVPHPVIVPGGRFREFYYWDSYWIVRGLLLSEMRDTVRGMLGNFLSIVERLGFVPNGGRVYYSMRSQPPLLIPMVDSYLNTTGDEGFLRDNIDTLEKEYRFWTTNRSVEVEKGGKRYRMARYCEGSSGPRPESYREDVGQAEFFRSPPEKEEFYSELKSAAESGWDFSSRWFIVNGSNRGNLTGLKIRSLVPVDLNAMLCWNARILSDFYRKLGKEEKAEEFRGEAERWREAIEEVLWHDGAGAWLDYDLINDRRRDFFSPSNLSPLWTDCYDPLKREHHVDKVLNYLKRTKVTENPGGVPTTTEHSGEQWDYPNAWPPLQYALILGLENTGDPAAEELAYELAQIWIRSNFKAFNETNHMYEKYDATIVGSHGGGGEYEVQLGFGWTNGVVMELLDRYGSRLRAEDEFLGAVEPGPRSSATLAAPHRPAHAALTLGLALIATLAAGCIGLMVYTRRQATPLPKFPDLRYSKIPHRKSTSVY